ncbi:hypothetical protein [Streptomyces resistomycificus]|uniref:Uncharacterized protein n=1 Tax=Streptomyces resistomycificus TaxID=67356 RepID=A0A0L8LAQ6_9ACTN|nr:hypothetical protein [Streptomyces resistomycificus]KOG35202.1 hypothetical protein ADK37_16375 [Streptomyces resistomycificus]KUN99936.1 hypothetical protein AQJ84_09635 [Streptomyces resistomycificus]
MTTPGTELTVTLSGGSTADAQKVVRALEPAFGAPDKLPSDENATVHTATFAAGAGGPGQGDVGRLSAPVTVTVQGAPEVVEKASDTLTRAFHADDQGTASGDQEQERQLVLSP